MAVTLLPLHIVDISGVQSWVKSQQALVSTFAKLADKVSGGIPGVPDIKAIIINIIKSQVDTLIKLAKAAEIAMIMNLPVFDIDECIDVINQGKDWFLIKNPSAYMKLLD